MKSILLAATALAMLGGTAFAQTSQSNSGSNATVNTASGSQSQSISNPKVNVIGNPIGNGASSSNSGAKATSNTRSAARSAAVGNTTNVTVGYTGYAGIDNSGNSASKSGGTAGTGSAADPSTGTAAGTAGSGGGYTGTNYSGSYTVRNTPEVIPPSVVGGNPCAVGASGGLSLPGFGIAAGGTWADKACERRQQAALMFNMGENKVAYELMCQDERVHQAMLSSGKPCAADAPSAPVAQAPAPAMVAATVPAPIVPVVAHISATPRPAWCAKAAPSTEASKAYVAQVCGL